MDELVSWRGPRVDSRRAKGKEREEKSKRKRVWRVM